VILFFCLLVQLYRPIRERFKNRKRITTIVCLTIVLGISFLYPDGLIDFERLQGKDLIVAQREGAANCTITFRFKKTNQFSETDICFGVERGRGTYLMKDDTVYLNYNRSTGSKGKYSFAVIKLHSTEFSQAMGEVKFFKEKNDSLPLILILTKYDL
jgi:hypothetical protein